VLAQQVVQLVEASPGLPLALLAWPLELGCAKWRRLANEQ